MLDKDGNPLWKQIPEGKYKRICSREPINLCEDIYQNIKKGGAWKEDADKYYAEHGKNPEWLQKLIDRDAQKNSNEEVTGTTQKVNRTQEKIKDQRTDTAE